MLDLPEFDDDPKHGGKSAGSHSAGLDRRSRLISGCCQNAELHREHCLASLGSKCRRLFSPPALSCFQLRITGLVATGLAGWRRAGLAGTRQTALAETCCSDCTRLAPCPRQYRSARTLIREAWKAQGRCRAPGPGRAIHGELLAALRQQRPRRWSSTCCSMKLTVFRPTATLFQPATGRPTRLSADRPVARRQSRCHCSNYPPRSASGPEQAKADAAAALLLPQRAGPRHWRVA